MESEQDIFNRSRESKDLGHETKEAEINPELQAAASMERADYLVKEVKQSKKQMQNIVLHMQQVKQAIKQIRAQLQLQASADPTSLEQDQKQVEKLQEQIKQYQDELIKMKDDLIREQIEELKNSAGVTLSADQLKQKAEIMVNDLISQTEA